MARKQSSSMMLGVLLLVVGGVLLATRLMAIGAAPAWLLGLGLGFGLLAVFQRSYTELMIGTLLLGLGAGMVLGDARLWGLGLTAWRLVALGAGFLLLYLVGVVLGLSRNWWSALVGIVLVAVGLLPFARTPALIPPSVEAAIRTWWPAALVVVGLVLILKTLKR